MRFTLCLPRDELSIPVARHICRRSLDEVGVVPDCSDDIAVALTEACTNVLVHSGPGDEYEVHLGIDEEVCTISVVDAGRGFDASRVGRRPDDTSETGLGVLLMQGLVDRVRFDTRSQDGSVVHLEKALEFVPDSPAARLRRSDGGIGRSERPEIG